MRQESVGTGKGMEPSEERESGSRRVRERTPEGGEEAEKEGEEGE